MTWFLPDDWWPAGLLALGQRDELEALRAGVIRARTDDLAVDALLDDVRGPARGAADDEQRREHGRGYAHEVVGHGGEPIEVRKHVLDAFHRALDAIGDQKALR